MVVKIITNIDDFREYVGMNDAIVDFSATWCGPCKKIGPRFHQLSEVYSEVKFCKVDIDDLEGLATYFMVESVPTFIILKKGQTVSQWCGASVDSLEQELATHFGSIGSIDSIGPAPSVDNR